MFTIENILNYLYTLLQQFPIWCPKAKVCANYKTIISSKDATSKISLVDIYHRDFCYSIIHIDLLHINFIFSIFWS